MIQTQDMLRRGWAVLGPPTDRQLASFPLDTPPSRLNCRLAVDRAGSRHLLVPVAGDQIIPSHRGSALVVEQRWLVFGDIEQFYIDLSCVDPELYREFDELAADVLEALLDEAEPGRAVLGVVSRWRRLFRAALVGGLGEQERRGLFAELACLSALLDVDTSMDVLSWTGPVGRPHDFELPRVCLEVKAIGTTSEWIRVHGLDQLATHGNRPLHLVVLTVVEDRAGRTIDELVRDIEERVLRPDQFRQRLTSAGWVRGSSNEQYGIGQVTGVEITTAVPRLIPESLVSSKLPEGVGKVEYSVDHQQLLGFATHSSLPGLAAEVLS